MNGIVLDFYNSYPSLPLDCTRHPPDHGLCLVDVYPALFATRSERGEAVTGTDRYLDARDNDNLVYRQLSHHLVQRK